jgi:glycosyltransferase involved in cell wall biosynthesis
VPLNIAAFIWGDHPSANYRAIHPLNELARRGHVIGFYPDEAHLQATDEELDALADEFDVVFMMRHSDEHAQALARRLRERAMPVVWDYDDDVRSEEYIARATAMAQAVDVVTTTNDILADRHLERGARYVISIPNYLTRRAAETPRRKHDGLVLGYIGWIDHQDDWDQLGFEEIVRELLDLHEDLRVESVGPIDLRLPRERYSQTDALPFDQLPGRIAGFDLAIAPLIDRIGNDTRSDIKLKEYAIAGVPWLASPLGPYAEHGEEHGGQLVADDEWFEALDDLISDGKLRKKLAKAGQKWAREQTLERNVDIWEDALLEAIELAEERSEAA